MSDKAGLFRNFYYGLLDLIYPERHVCFICEKHDEDVGDSHICEECLKGFIFIGNAKCDVCGKPLGFKPTSGKCEDCVRVPNYYSYAMAPLEYDGPIKAAIYKYKYAKKSYMYKSFGFLLKEYLNEKNVENIDLIVPVPLHRSKLISRGFNQAELICRFLSSSLDIKCDSKNLIRTKKTSIQNKLSGLQRRLNIKDAFEVRKSEVFKDKVILLVDDIVTTGSTVNECSKVLLKAKAKEVIVLSIATGRKI